MDAILNSGPTGVINLIRVKEEIAMGSILQKLARGVHGVSPNNTSLDIDGLPVSLAAAGGSYAGITLGGFWLCNGGNGPKTSVGNLGTSLGAVQTEYGNATFGNEEPTVLLVTQIGWNRFWTIMINNQRFVQEDQETTRAGFMNLMFNRAAVLHDQFVPAQTIYGITEKYAHVVIHPWDYFRVDPFLQPTNQRVIVSHIFVLINLQMLTLRQHFVMSGVTDA